ncbi:hypothetical protein SISSUDRAFT_994930 [Sistotremastrum suecicum HHB10207 ss-3]|uniref:Uncharacterized protein n=1 Tax=Sistotremastrum suecicum HHB10207 ss-3 TaxID=1314776 RepID=A0A165WVY7_9AGAM|nr:hypothetical protein SISSUDRAFT_994930 [Sistotremastrum suecicum HHB10207 ss-3]
MPIITFEDDVSGNISNQWNIHYSMLWSCLGLPRKELEKMINVNFATTSQHASPMELMKAVMDMLIEAQENPWKVWDCNRKQHILVIPWLAFASGDNPMQSEFCSHIGLNANQKCRVCHVGGPEKDMLTEMGYLSLFEPQRPRDPKETLEVIKRLVELAMFPGGEKKMKELMTLAGVKDTLSHALVTRLIELGKSLKGKPHAEVQQLLKEEAAYHDWENLHNILLDLKGFNVHASTPVEPLHTILLGIVKYFWTNTMWHVEDQKTIAEFRARLKSLNEQGLKLPKLNGDYMIRFKGGLVGKHFKIMTHIMSFVTHGLVPDHVYNAWVILGRLVVQLWHTDIADIDSYVVRTGCLLTRACLSSPFYRQNSKKPSTKPLMPWLPALPS